MSDKLQQIKDEYAKEKRYSSWGILNNEGSSFWADTFDTECCVNEIAKRYAEACCKATLEKAANNTYINQTGEEIAVFSGFDKPIILNPSNIVIL